MQQDVITDDENETPQSSLGVNQKNTINSPTLNNKNFNACYILQDNGYYYIQINEKKERKDKTYNAMTLKLINESVYIYKACFKESQYPFKILAESEKFTNLLKKSKKDDLQKAFEDIFEEIATSIISIGLDGKSTEKEYEKPYQYKRCIPYPGQSTCSWSPQGHLMTIHNTPTLIQKQQKDQHCLFQTNYELYTYAFSQPKQTKSNQIHRHVVEMKEDEENLQPFFQTGIKLLSSQESEEYDYLNYKFYQHYFPLFHQQLQPPIKEPTSRNDYEFYDLQQDLTFLGDQFVKLSKKVFESQKKTVINQNIEISIYDFSGYSFKIENSISQLHENYIGHLKHHYDSSIKILFAPFEDHFKLFDSQIGNFLKNGNEQYNIKILKIIVDCIHNQQEKEVPKHEMNILNDFQEYSKQLWNTRYEIYGLYDQIIQTLKQWNSHNYKDLIEKVQQLKGEVNLEMTHLIKFLINSEIQKHLNSQVQNVTIINGTDYVVQNKFLDMYNKIPFQIQFNKLNTFPLLSCNSVTVKLQVLKNALRAQSSPINYCIFKKLRQQGKQILAYKEELNNSINSVRIDQINNGKTQIYCTVCQNIIMDTGIFCSKCKHGTHVYHKSQKCYQCDCNCPKI